MPLRGVACHPPSPRRVEIRPPRPTTVQAARSGGKLPQTRPLPLERGDRQPAAERVTEHRESNERRRGAGAGADEAVPVDTVDELVGIDSVEVSDREVNRAEMLVEC